MAACLDNPAFVHHQDGIAFFHRGQAVGNHQHGTSPADRLKIVHDDFLRLIIKGTGGLITNQDSRIQNQRPGNGDALALAAGQQAAPLAYEGIVAVRQLPDEAVRPCQPCRLYHLLMGGVGTCQPDIFLDCPPEKHAVLQHHAYLAAQPGRLHLCHIHTVQQDASLLRQIEALYQLGQGALAGAGASHDAHLHAGGNPDAHVFQHIPAIRRVAEGDIVQGDFPLQARQGGTVGIEDRLRLLVHDIPQPVHGYPGLLEVLPHVHQAHDRRYQASRHHLEGDELAYGNRMVHDVDGTCPDNGKVEYLL